MASLHLYQWVGLVPIVVLVAIQLVQSIVVRSLFQYAAML